MSFKCIQCCSYRFGRIRGKVCLLNVFSAAVQVWTTKRCLLQVWTLRGKVCCIQCCSYRFGRLRGKVCLLNVFSAAATGLDD